MCYMLNGVYANPDVMFVSVSEVLYEIERKFVYGYVMSKRKVSHTLVSKEPLCKEDWKVISNFYVESLQKLHGN